MVGARVSSHLDRRRVSRWLEGGSGCGLRCDVLNALTNPLCAWPTAGFVGSGSDFGAGLPAWMAAAMCVAGMVLSDGEDMAVVRASGRDPGERLRHGVEYRSRHSTSLGSLVNGEASQPARGPQ